MRGNSKQTICSIDEHCPGLGFFTTKQAINAGYADNTHTYHVRAGNWERIWRGIYRWHHYPAPEDGDKVAWYLWSRGRDEKPPGVYFHMAIENRPILRSLQDRINT